MWSKENLWALLALSVKDVWKENKINYLNTLNVIASPPQISTSPSSGGPCYNKRGTDDQKWAE
jgi:hypothetical protein